MIKKLLPLLLLILFVGCQTPQNKIKSNRSRDCSDYHILKDTEFDLVGKHSQEIQYYVLETKLTTYALDGSRVGTDVFRLHLKCTPTKLAQKDRDEYTCVRFTIKQGNAKETSIPALENWKYLFYSSGIDKKGHVFGIDHAKFEKLVDQHGKALMPDKSYHVYNSFIDFHAFCNVFANRTLEGNGIQDLRKIGDKIVHASAFSEPPVNVGSNVAKGSFFKNGEITLAFKGLSVVNDKLCAIISYDSGDSSFKMIMKPAPNMEIKTVGRSHYKGDIYKNLTSNWVQKVTMDEVIISESKLPVPPHKINSVHERNLIIRNVSADEFELD